MALADICVHIDISREALPHSHVALSCFSFLCHTSSPAPSVGLQSADGAQPPWRRRAQLLRGGPERCHSPISLSHLPQAWWPSHLRYLAACVDSSPHPILRVDADLGRAAITAAVLAPLQASLPSEPGALPLSPKSPGSDRRFLLRRNWWCLRHRRFVLSWPWCEQAGGHYTGNERSCPTSGGVLHHASWGPPSGFPLAYARFRIIMHVHLLAATTPNKLTPT